MPDFHSQIRAHYDARSLSPQTVAQILERARKLEILPDPSGSEDPKIRRFQPADFEGNQKNRSSSDQRYSLRPLLALAAALVFAALLAGGWQMYERAQPVSFAVLAPRVVDFFAANPTLPKVSSDPGQLQLWLENHGAPADFVIPASLAALPSYGCKVVDVHHRSAYLMCFWREQTARPSPADLVHLLVTRLRDFRDTPAEASPEMREMRGWSFASWRQGELIYTLATPAPMEKLRPFLSDSVAWKSGIQTSRKLGQSDPLATFF